MANNHNNKRVTLGLIAARKGSTGIKNKNLIKFKKKEIKICQKMPHQCFL